MSCLLLFDIDGTLVNFKDKHSLNIFIDMFKNIFNEDISLSKLPPFDGATDISILLHIARTAGIPEQEIFKSLDRIWDYLFNSFIKITNTQNLQLLSNSDLLLNNLSLKPNIDLALLTGNFRKNAYLKLGTYKLDRHFDFGAFGDAMQRTETIFPNLLSIELLHA